VCHQCKSSDLPILEITHLRDRGDLPRNATHKSKQLFLLSKRVKKALGLHYHRAPSRYVLNAIREYRVPEEVSDWYCAVFLNGVRFCGFLDEDICVMGAVEEVEKDMAKQKMIQIRIDDHLHRWFKVYAADQGLSMTDIIISYIKYLKRKSEKSVEVEQI